MRRERLEQRDVPCARVLTRSQMIRHPQIAANGCIAILEHPQAGPLRQALQPARFSTTANEMRSAAPALGEHTRSVLLQCGIANEQIDAMLAAGSAHSDGDPV